MRFLRHSAVQRVFSLGLLLSLGLWLSAPVAGADAGRALASQAKWLHLAPPPVEAAFAEALDVAASQGVRTPEAFTAAFAEALATQQDPVLARFLNSEVGADALLSVLYGHLLRAFSHHTGLEAAPSPPVASPSGSTPSASLAWALPADVQSSLEATSLGSGREAPACVLAERSSAQPLGP